MSEAPLNADPEAAVWLQTENDDGTFRSEQFFGVPVARPSLITLVSSGSADARQWVAQLREELVATLLSASPSVQQDAIPTLPDYRRIAPPKSSDRKRVLILVGDQAQPFGEASWYAHWDPVIYPGEATVMTVLRRGNFDDYFSAEIRSNNNHVLRRLNAGWWRDSIAEVAPEIFSCSEVTAGVARIFISYRRIETLPLALQLFDRLGRERFEVFLDQFSIPPGLDFQRRLGQELEDKSMVVLLESKHIQESPWTQHEIDFAKRRQLGLLSLRMPDVDLGKGLPSINADAVKSLLKTDFTAPPRSVSVAPNTIRDEWQTLEKTSLEDVIAEIKRVHAQALFRRRRHLREDLELELGRQGLTVVMPAYGPISASLGTDKHLLWPTTWPPDVEDFRTTHQAHSKWNWPGGVSRRIVVGPHSAQQPDRLARLHWLRDVSDCRLFDEGNLPALAKYLADGAKP
jgi:hypothetical protein